MNGHYDKKYGGHKYPDRRGTSNCEYECGCSMGDSSSSGPTGLDPFGTCPRNPEDGKLLGGNEDYHYVVKERISSLTSRANKAEARLEQVDTSKAELADKLASVEKELAQKKLFLAQISHLIGTGPMV